MTPLPAGRRPMTPDEHAKLADLVAYDNEDEPLGEWAEQFIESLNERNQEYGVRTLVSPKQAEKLAEIWEQFCSDGTQTEVRNAPHLNEQKKWKEGYEAGYKAGFDAGVGASIESEAELEAGG